MSPPQKETGPPRGPASSSTIGTPTDNRPDSTKPTVADLLAQSKQARSYRGQRLVERFLKLGVDRYGLWWEFMLSSPPEDLDPMDSMFITATWRQFTNGDKPFRRRRVAA